MGNWLARIFTKALIGRIVKFIQEFMEELRLENEVREKLDEIQKEEDPAKRAKRIHTMLNS